MELIPQERRGSNNDCENFINVKRAQGGKGPRAVGPPSFGMGGANCGSPVAGEMGLNEKETPTRSRIGRGRVEDFS